jgi:dTDP-4-amino-4,6-dideoxygalactose transaminase
MDKITAFAKKHNLFVIEDNAEAFGGSYKGKKTGTLGDIAGCSFCQNKTFTTGGEGGMVTTDNEDLAWNARSFRDHGYDVQQRLSLMELEQKLPYIHNMVGWNYRMTEMQSAIGLAELDRMDNWNMPARRRNAKIVIDALRARPEVKYFPVDTPERQNGWYVLAFSLDLDQMNCDIQEFVQAVVAEGAPCWKSSGRSATRSGRSGNTIRSGGAGSRSGRRIRYAVERGLQPCGSAQRAVAREAHVHVLRVPDIHRGRHAPDRRRAWSK